MNERVQELFHLLADLSSEARTQYFAEHDVDFDTCREVEALLAFDSGASAFLLRDISVAAERSLPQIEPENWRCGPYRLLRILGRGGMGSVHLAERADGEVDQRVAIKFLRPGADERAFRDRFLRERQILATLRHPGIAGLLDAGHTADGRPYLAMDYVEGIPIDEYAEKLDVSEKLTLFIQVCEAVSYAHQNLIIHRDIKPSNILVDTAGQPKLLDFGVAKLLDATERSGAETALTREGGVALTPEYAAPEQVSGGPVTTAIDVYALGVLLFVLLTGKHPAGPGPHSPMGLLKAILDTEAPRPSEVVGATAETERQPRLRRLLRGDLDTIVAKALKKHPRDRYDSVAAFADDLRRHIRHEPISVRPDAIAYRAAKFVQRNRMAVVLATTALAASIVGVVGIVIQARAARAQRDFAFRQLSRAEAINDLNSFLFSDVAPSGKSFTVKELLGRAEHLIGRQRNKSDANRIELLVSIGRQYALQNDDAAARRVLVEAYNLARKLSDTSTRARSACALASVLPSAGELQRAEALYEEGLNELPAEPMFTLDRIFCLEAGAEVALQRGESKELVSRIKDVEVLSTQSPVQSELMQLSLLMDLAESYRVARQLRDACVTFEHAAALLELMGRDDTHKAVALFNNWSLALYLLGQPAEAERIARRGIEISSDKSNEQAVSPVQFVNYARVLRDLARLDEAADYAERGYRKAIQSRDQVALIQASIVLAAICRERGDLLRAGHLLSEVEPRLRRDLPAGHYAFASLALEHALLAEARGDLRSALELANHAITMLDASIKAGRQGGDLLPLALERRSALELRLHLKDEATADAARALSLLKQTAQPGTFSSTLGRAYLALMRSLQAEGKTREARDAGRSAVQHLQNSLGVNHPDTRSARELDAQFP
jgi:serine/threonine protein kinase/tetratricopeptide (TPR) repeat protein